MYYYNNIMTNSFRGGSRITDILGRLLDALWRLIKATQIPIVCGMGLSMAIISVVLQTLFCSMFVWQGWNRGLVNAAGLQPIEWTTAFWCSLMLYPFMTSSKSKSES